MRPRAETPYGRAFSEERRGRTRSTSEEWEWKPEFEKPPPEPSSPRQPPEDRSEPAARESNDGTSPLPSFDGFDPISGRSPEEAAPTNNFGDLPIPEGRAHSFAPEVGAPSPETLRRKRDSEPGGPPSRIEKLGRRLSEIRAPLLKKQKASQPMPDPSLLFPCPSLVLLVLLACRRGSLVSHRGSLVSRLASQSQSTT